MAEKLNPQGGGQAPRSLDALFAKHRGRLRTGGELRRELDELRSEWE